MSSSNFHYSIEALKEAVLKSESIRETIKRLGGVPNQSRYEKINKDIKEHQINISHFLGSAWNKGKTHPEQETPIEDYLNNKKRITSYQLREKLIKKGFKERKCEQCLLSEWQGKLIPISLHHIDHNHFNNNLSNLIILCPNCHALEHAQEIKKQKPRLVPQIPEEEFIKLIPECYNKREVLLTLGLTARGQNYTRIANIIKKYNLEFKKRLIQPKESKRRPRKVEWPSKQELEKMVWEIPTQQIAKNYGVSDNAVAKWCVLYGISKPPRGYWSKKAYGKI